MNTSLAFSSIRRFLTCAFIGSVLALAPRIASAEEHGAASSVRDERPFSRAGRIVFPELAGISSGPAAGVGPVTGVGALGGVGVSGLVSYGASSGGNEVSGRSKSSSLTLSPAADFFVDDHWTVGLAASVGKYDSSTTQGSSGGATPTNLSGYDLSATPRLGRTFDLGPVVLWPKLGLGYGTARTHEAWGEPSTQTRWLTRTIFTQLTAELVFPLTRNVIFDLGPVASFALTDQAWNEPGKLSDWTKNFNLGVQAHLGLTL